MTDTNAPATMGDDRVNLIREALNYGGDYMPDSLTHQRGYDALNELLVERDELRAACLANSEKLGQEGSRMSALIVEAAARAEVAERRVVELEAALEEIESWPISGYHAGAAQRLARAALGHAAEPALTQPPAIGTGRDSDGSYAAGTKPETGGGCVSVVVPAPTGEDDPIAVAERVAAELRDALGRFVAWFDAIYPAGQSKSLPGFTLYSIATDARAVLARDRSVSVAVPAPTGDDDGQQ